MNRNVFINFYSKKLIINNICDNRVFIRNNGASLDAKNHENHE